MERKRSLVLAERRLPVRRVEEKRSCEERLERALDEALEQTFPASDPPATTAPGERCD